MSRGSTREMGNSFRCLQSSVRAPARVTSTLAPAVPRCAAVSAVSAGSGLHHAQRPCFCDGSGKRIDARLRSLTCKAVSYARRLAAGMP